MEEERGCFFLRISYSLWSEFLATLTVLNLPKPQLQTAKEAGYILYIHIYSYIYIYIYIYINILVVTLNIKIVTEINSIIVAKSNVINVNNSSNVDEPVPGLHNVPTYTLIGD